MSESKSLFAAVIEEHLALKRRNAHLNGQRPLSAYEVADPFDNHALFKSEAEARREEEETGDYPALDTSEFSRRSSGSPTRSGSTSSSARISTGATELAPGASAPSLARLTVV